MTDLTTSSKMTLRSLFKFWAPYLWWMACPCHCLSQDLTFALSSGWEGFPLPLFWCYGIWLLIQDTYIALLLYPPGCSTLLLYPAALPAAALPAAALPTRWYIPIRQRITKPSGFPFLCFFFLFLFHCFLSGFCFLCFVFFFFSLCFFLGLFLECAIMQQCSSCYSNRTIYCTVSNSEPLHPKVVSNLLVITYY